MGSYWEDLKHPELFLACFTKVLGQPRFPPQITEQAAVVMIFSIGAASAGLSWDLLVSKVYADDYERSVCQPRLLRQGYIFHLPFSHKWLIYRLAIVLRKSPMSFTYKWRLIQFATLENL